MCSCKQCEELRMFFWCHSLNIYRIFNIMLCIFPKTHFEVRNDFFLHIFDSCLSQRSCLCVSLTDKKIQIMRLEVKSSRNVNDPAVKNEILAKVSSIYFAFNICWWLTKITLYNKSLCSSDREDTEGEGTNRRCKTVVASDFWRKCLSEDVVSEEWCFLFALHQNQELIAS